MPRRALSDRFCQHARPADGELQTDYFDVTCKGLALRVSGRSRTWSYVCLWGGKRHRLTLGTYPATSLAKAHTLVDECRQAIEAGNDPRSLMAARDPPRRLRPIAA